MNVTYKRYPSTLKIQYAQGVLRRDMQHGIPRSTRKRWKQLSVDSFWIPGGFVYTDSHASKNNQYTFRYLRPLLCLLRIHQGILQSFPLKHQQVLPVQHYINQAIRYMGDAGSRILWRYLPFSYKQWAAWNSRKVCTASLVLLCRRKHPSQLSRNEVQIIREACSLVRFRHWPLSSIYYQLIREQEINCSLSTFYKYCRLLHITRKQIRKPMCYTPLSSSAPLSVLHMDVTLFKTVNGVKHYLYLIRDNYSRAILACKAATSYSSEIARDTLHEVLDRFGLITKEGTLITDGGSENKGALTEWLGKTGSLWKKIVAQVDIVQSNSMAEAANKIIKYRYLFPNPIADTGELVQILDKALTDYNQMPQKNLYGLTPDEVLNGTIPDKHRFKTQIAAARKKRISVNQAVSCSDNCSP